MYKKIVIAAVAAAMSLGLMAQNIQETVVTVAGLTSPAFTMSFEKTDVKTVQEAVKLRFADAKLKTKTVEGFYAVPDQLVSEIASAPVSIYTKVSEQGKKKDKMVVLTVCVTTTDLTIDQNVLKDNVRAYMAGFPPYIERYENLKIMNLEQENLKKAEKAAAAAASDVAALDKSIAASQKKIADKQAEIKKLGEKIKQCESDIKDLEKNIEKDKSKKAEAEKKAAAANEKVDAVRGEVERYRNAAETSEK